MSFRKRFFKYANEKNLAYAYEQMAKDVFGRPRLMKKLEEYLVFFADWKGGVYEFIDGSESNLEIV